LDIGLSLDKHMFGGEAAGNFPGKVNRDRLVALKIAAQFPFEQRGSANYARAAKVSFGSEMNVATGANGSTETGRDFVIAEIDVRAAPGAIGRCGCVTDFVFPFALETCHDATLRPAPKSLESSRCNYRFR
jgi:hypothetical protein